MVSAPGVRLIDVMRKARVDWEVELAAVVGRRTRHISRADALDAVYGYTVSNDISACDVQFADGQWTRRQELRQLPAAFTGPKLRPAVPNV